MFAFVSITGMAQDPVRAAAAACLIDSRFAATRHRPTVDLLATQILRVRAEPASLCLLRSSQQMFRGS